MVCCAVWTSKEDRLVSLGVYSYFDLNNNKVDWEDVGMVAERDISQIATEEAEASYPASHEVDDQVIVDVDVFRRLVFMLLR